ncbi:hypothetical protein [Roseomonas chloroacetimidivorans]|uniref:hypothetical protein n=1 Tax=Roseomonas chloroacetimidivorans TaxID=1766656 RepID=UPI003C72BA75
MQEGKATGMLVDGKWHDVWYDTEATGGRFVRSDSQFRNWITQDGSPGPSGEGGFKAELGRYHLYVSLACPWAHRTLIVRALKELGDMIPASCTASNRLDDYIDLASTPNPIQQGNAKALFQELARPSNAPRGKRQP